MLTQFEPLPPPRHSGLQSGISIMNHFYAERHTKKTRISDQRSSGEEKALFQSVTSRSRACSR
jgi:hypothetical protein